MVHSGARDAHDRDYEVVILEDCCAGVTADEHMHALACLGRFATIVGSGEFDFGGSLSPPQSPVAVLHEQYRATF